MYIGSAAMGIIVDKLDAHGLIASVRLSNGSSHRHISRGKVRAEGVKRLAVRGKEARCQSKTTLRNASETPPCGSGALLCRCVAPRNGSEAPPSHSEAPRNDSEAPARHSEATRNRGEVLFCASVLPRNPSVGQFRHFPPPRNDRMALPSALVPKLRAWARGSLVFRLAFPREPTALLDAPTLRRLRRSAAAGSQRVSGGRFHGRGSSTTAARDQ